MPIGNVLIIRDVVEQEGPDPVTCSVQLLGSFTVDNDTAFDSDNFVSSITIPYLTGSRRTLMVAGTGTTTQLAGGEAAWLSNINLSYGGVDMVYDIDIIQTVEITDFSFLAMLPIEGESFSDDIFRFDASATGMSEFQSMNVAIQAAFFVNIDQSENTLINYDELISENTFSGSLTVTPGGGNGLVVTSAAQSEFGESLDIVASSPTGLTQVSPSADSSNAAQGEAAYQTDGDGDTPITWTFNDDNSFGVSARAAKLSKDCGPVGGANNEFSVTVESISGGDLIGYSNNLAGGFGAIDPNPAEIDATATIVTVVSSNTGEFVIELQSSFGWPAPYTTATVTTASGNVVLDLTNPDNTQTDFTPDNEQLISFIWIEPVFTAADDGQSRTVSLS